MAHAAPAVFDATSAFDVLKGLEGKWSIQSGDKTLPFQMTYAIGSKGSIVSEQFGRELSVFYRDGQDLAMIHFCNAGNQPRLRLKKESSSPALLDFETIEISNLSAPGAAHVQRITYKIVDNQKIDLGIEWQRGASQEWERYQLNKAD